MRELVEFPGYWVTEDGRILSMRTLVDGTKTRRELSPHATKGHVWLRRRGRDYARQLVSLLHAAYPERYEIPEKRGTSIPAFVGEVGVAYETLKLFPGYMFGDDGSVWSCRKGGGGFGGSFRKLSPYIDNAGYAVTALTNSDGKSCMVTIHRKILEAFVGPCPKRMEGCHFDGDRTNNKLSNLRWDTRSANHADKKRHGTGNKGSRHNLAKLTESQVLEIRSKYESERKGPRYGRHYTLKSLAAEYGVTKSMIARIVKRQNWTHI